MVRNYLIGVVTGLAFAPLAADAVSLVIQQTQVEVYTKAEVDALLANQAHLPVAISDVTGLQAALDGKAPVSALATKVNVAGVAATLYAGTTAQCNAISPKDPTTVYICAP